MKILLAAVISASLITGCTARAPNSVRLLAGVAEGIAAAPSFVDSDLQ